MWLVTTLPLVLLSPYQRMLLGWMASLLISQRLLRTVGWLISACIQIIFCFILELFQPILNKLFVWQRHHIFGYRYLTYVFTCAMEYEPRLQITEDSIRRVRIPHSCFKIHQIGNTWRPGVHPNKTSAWLVDQYFLLSGESARPDWTWVFCWQPRQPCLLPSEYKWHPRGLNRCRWVGRHFFVNCFVFFSVLFTYFSYPRMFNDMM